MTERANKLEFLEWWYGRADFGPAEEDVRRGMEEEFERVTGRLVPEGFRLKDDDQQED